MPITAILPSYWQPSNYAACLKRIHNVQEGNEREVDAVCVVAIHRHHCEAAEMREREIEAGKALYYIDRSEMRKQVGEASG